MYWEPGTNYGFGDVVEYEGHRYKIIQPHFSQSDWTPPITPALWGRMSDQDTNYGGDCKQQQPLQQQGQSYDQQSQSQGDHNQTNDPSNTGEKPEKHWYEDEETKKKLEIGGGLAAGAALLAGGLFAYKKHEEHKEQAKADAWSHDNWLQEARVRRDNYHRHGSNDPVTWVLTRGQDIPKGAILVGREKSWNLYICRAFYDGGVLLGKASEGFQNGGVLGYNNKEVFVEEYEVLLGDMSRLRWVPCSGKINVASLGLTPVVGGKAPDGTPLYVVEAPYKDAVHPGKASESKEGAYIAYDGKEVHIREYRVLCYNNSPY